MKVYVSYKDGETANVWIERDNQDSEGLPFSLGKRLPEGIAIAEPRDRDAALRTAARDFATAYYYTVIGDFEPGEVQDHIADKYTVWCAPVKKDNE